MGTKPSLEIDLSEFRLKTNLGTPETELHLKFAKKSRKFYLALIALVADQMKEALRKERRKREDELPYIQMQMEDCIQHLLLLNKYFDIIVGQRNKEKNLLRRIYRKWHKLADLDSPELFEIEHRRKHTNPETRKREYSFTQEESDKWSMLFDRKGSEKAPYLRLSVNNWGLSPQKILIKYRDGNGSKKGNDWKRFIETVRNKTGVGDYDKPNQKAKKRRAVSEHLITKTPDTRKLVFSSTNEQGYEDYINRKDGSMMIYIPAGEFLMGSEDGLSNERPRHKVSLDAYFVGKYPVTVNQYMNFCKKTGHTIPDEPTWGWKDNHPIVGVSWFDANAYCRWLDIRLPTEAEWEYAAGGVDGRRYPWGEEMPDEKYVNLKPLGSPSAVGEYPKGASPFGLMDMVGNVWQWVQDFYGETFYGNSPISNPGGPGGGLFRVIRGGSWFNNGSQF